MPTCTLRSTTVRRSISGCILGFDLSDTQHGERYSVQFRSRNYLGSTFPLTCRYGRKERWSGVRRADAPSANGKAARRHGLSPPRSIAACVQRRHGTFWMASSCACGPARDRSTHRVRGWGDALQTPRASGRKDLGSITASPRCPLLEKAPAVTMPGHATIFS